MMNFISKIPIKNIYKKEFLNNETIFKSNDLCSSICYIKRGKIAKMNGNTIIEIYNQYNIIGLDIIFSSNPFYEYNYITLELTSVDLILKEHLISSNVINEILEYNSNQLIQMKEYVKILLCKTNKEKLLFFLYLEYKKRNSTSFIIEMTKAELSNYLNINKNELSKIISELTKSRIIANQNKLYTLIDLNYFIF